MILSKDFADPVVAVIEALASDERRRILIELDEARNLSYSRILERIGLGKGTLNYHLKKLAAAGMIRNYIHNEVEPYSSYYEVSEFGRNVIDNLLDSFRPPSKHIRFSVLSATSYDVQVFESRQKEWKETQDAANASAPEIIPIIR